MKKLLQKVWSWVRGVYEKVMGTSTKLVPVAIRVVEGLKRAMEGNVDDVVAFIIKRAIKGEADDLIIDKVKKMVEDWLPKIALELNIINSINGIEDKNDQLKAILDEIKKLDQKGQWITWHSYAVMIIDLLADGEWSWSDSVVLAEAVFKELEKEGRL